MQWYVDTTNWTVHHATAATAEANGWYGPYPTQAAAQAAANQGSGGTGGGGGGGQGSPAGGGQWWVINAPGSHVTPFLAVQSATKPQFYAAGPFKTKAEAQAWISKKEAKFPSLPNPVSGLNAIGDFFSKLGQANTWIRVAEVLLGLGLIIVGLAKLASGTAAGKAALKAGKAAAIL